MLPGLWHFVTAAQADHYTGQSIQNIFWLRVREESSDTVMWTVQRTVLLLVGVCQSHYKFPSFGCSLPPNSVCSHMNLGRSITYKLSSPFQSG